MGSGGRVTRGFTGRRRGGKRRLPPGQYDVGPQFPVLSAEATPRIDTERWSFRIEGAVREAVEWDWEGIHRLPPGSYSGAIHCVTSWSKFDTSFSGVSVDELLDRAGPLPEATHAMAFSHTGYTTNLPLADITGGKAWVVWEYDGAPLPPEHGGPARLLVPHLYFWKSAKWVAGLRLMDHDEAGFWERNGYHHRGDPWQEQRYTGD